MKCPKCTEENAVESQFCRRCGAALQPPGAKARNAVLLVIALVVGVLAAAFVMAHSRSPSAGSATPAEPQSVKTADTRTVTHIGVAYGTEKRDWFTWAVDAFNRTPEAQDVQIDLMPMGSLEAAQAIVHGDQHIQVWSPASALYKNVFLRDWAAAHAGGNPIESEQQLALTPMVFVMWQQRYEPFAKKYPEVSFRTISSAMNEPGGWNTIANQPEWGFFKFSHTHPNQSNSGLVSLVLMAYDYQGTHRALSAGQITDPEFQKWLVGTERNQVGAASGLIDSTGTLMNAMVQRGWSTYDCVMVYESNAVERLREANGRWGELRVIYPRYNFWNDHPFYVLNVPWSTPAQRRAAGAFAKFLLSEQAQRQAMAHGFRPANVNVATNAADSPFVQYANVGVQVTVPGVFCEPPDANAIETLLLGWQRSQAGK
ncbi:MAG TPA: extracellular solute-binding protein [Humisphaera sp.]|jgi:hypothetical protein|nr:extracellular solute-binding protein [Humisphaera sp.]